MNLAQPHGYWLLIVIGVFTLFSIAPGNSDSRRLKWHEMLVAQTATEMLQSGDFLVPRLLQSPRLQKPPLSYWLTALAHKTLSKPGEHRVSEFEARLPSLISGFLLIFVTYGLGRLITRQSAGGLMAAVFVATSASFYLYSRNARPEMLYALMCAVMLLGFIWSIRRAEEDRSTTVSSSLAWMACSLALMAKGPQFPAFLLVGITLAHLLQKPRYSLSLVLRPWMALPALALPAAYFLYLGLKVDDAFSLWGTEMVQGDSVPLWYRPLRFYYPMVLILSLAPWLIVFGSTVKDLWKRREPVLMTVVFCLLVSVFLVSFAGKLRPHYVLPLIPLGAALMASSMLHIFQSINSKTSVSRSLKAFAWLQFAIIGIVPISLLWVYRQQQGEGSFHASALLWLALAVISYLVAALTAGRRIKAAFAFLVAAMLFITAFYSVLQVDESESSQAAYRFAIDVEEYLTAGGTLYLHSTRALPFHYYSSLKDENLALESWASAAERQPDPFFIIRRDILQKSGYPGDILIEQHHPEKDKALVLFRPTPDSAI
jgi:4-amino-4-deoxy-L-arabinose transferase-like glycosyltransferase